MNKEQFCLKIKVTNKELIKVKKDLVKFYRKKHEEMKNIYQELINKEEEIDEIKQLEFRTFTKTGRREEDRKIKEVMEIIERQVKKAENGDLTKSRLKVTCPSCGKESLIAAEYIWNAYKSYNGEVKCNECWKKEDEFTEEYLKKEFS